MSRAASNYVAILIATIFFTVASLSYGASGVDFKFHNKSAWKITHLYISEVKIDAWGPDQLEKEVVDPGELFTIKNVTPGIYDVKIVDEESDECIVRDVTFVADQSVTITDEKLVACQAATKIEEKSDELGNSDQE